MIYVYEYEARNRFSAGWICLQGIDCGLGSIGMGGISLGVFLDLDRRIRQSSFLLLAVYVLKKRF
jgi:hypothetical protein